MVQKGVAALRAGAESPPQLGHQRPGSGSQHRGGQQVPWSHRHQDDRQILSATGNRVSQGGPKHLGTRADLGNGDSLTLTSNPVVSQFYPSTLPVRGNMRAGIVTLHISGSNVVTHATKDSVIDETHGGRATGRTGARAVRYAGLLMGTVRRQNQWGSDRQAPIRRQLPVMGFRGHLDNLCDRLVVFPNPCHGPGQDAVFR